MRGETDIPGEVFANWLVLLAAFVAALVVLGRIPGLDQALAHPGNIVAARACAVVFGLFYQAASALDGTADW